MSFIHRYVSDTQIIDIGLNDFEKYVKLKKLKDKKNLKLNLDRNSFDTICRRMSTVIMSKLNGLSLLNYTLHLL